MLPTQSTKKVTGESSQKSILREDASRLSMRQAVLWRNLWKWEVQAKHWLSKTVEGFKLILEGENCWGVGYAGHRGGEGSQAVMAKMHLGRMLLCLSSWSHLRILPREADGQSDTPYISRETYYFIKQKKEQMETQKLVNQLQYYLWPQIIKLD